MGYYDRGFHLQRVVLGAMVAGPLDIGNLSSDDWTRLIYFANLSLAYFEIAKDRLVHERGVCAQCQLCRP